MKDEFLATLSHELRTPLNTVVGYAAMLRKGMMEESQQCKAVDVIHRNAQVLTRLVGELLDTSRIVTGQIRLDVRDGPFGAGARGRREHPAVGDAKGLCLDAQIQPGMAILGDRDRLRQVMWNLLTNAVKFTPNGGRIEIQVYGRVGPGAHSSCAIPASACRPKRCRTSLSGSGRRRPARSVNTAALGLGSRALAASRRTPWWDDSGD